jgi:hypothetical protein
MEILLPEWPGCESIEALVGGLMQLILENRSVNHTRFGYDFQWLYENQQPGGRTGKSKRQQDLLHTRIMLIVDKIMWVGASAPKLTDHA